MTKADIIRMAQEAGATIRQGHRLGVIVYEDGGNLSPIVLRRFAKLVAAAKQEECAKVCELIGFSIHGQGREDSEAFDCADAIRALNDEGGE